MAIETKDLEKALSYAKTQSADVGYFILKCAVEAFLSNQSKVFPQAPTVPQMPTAPTPDISKQWQEIFKKPSTGCPYCGLTGPHYCVGKRPGTGIEYWMNQPTCTGSGMVGGIGAGVGSALGQALEVAINRK